MNYLRPGKILVPIVCRAFGLALLLSTSTIFAVPISFSLLDDYVGPAGLGDSQSPSATWTYRDSTNTLLTPEVISVVSPDLVWTNPAGSIPVIGPSIINVNSGEIRAPSFDGLFMHPGFTEDATAMFLSPEELFITQVDILVEHVRTSSPSDGALFSVTGSSGTYLSSTLISPTTTGIFSQFSLFSISNPLHVSANDNINFIVNRNSNANSDWLNVSVTITGDTENPSSVPTAPTVPLLVGSLGILVVLKRRGSFNIRETE